MPAAFIAGVMFAIGWVFLNHNPSVHPKKDKAVIVKEVK